MIRWLKALFTKPNGKVSKGKTSAATGIAGAIAVAISMLIPYEGLELKAYRDIAGVPTICYGETRGVQMGDTATPEECRTALAKAVAEYEVGIRPCLPADLSSQTRGTFISVAYNIGIGGFCGSTMSKKARAGDLAGACNSIPLWNKARVNGVLQVSRGLVNRREKERQDCLEGI